MAAVAVNPLQAQLEPTAGVALQQHQQLLHNRQQDDQQDAQQMHAQQGQAPVDGPQQQHPHPQTQQKEVQSSGLSVPCDVCGTWNYMPHDEWTVRCPERLPNQRQCIGTLVRSDGPTDQMVECEKPDCDKWRVYFGEEEAAFVAKIKYWTCADMVHWGIKDASCATIDREWQDPNKVRAPATPSPGVSRQPPSGAQGRTKQTTKRAPRNVPKEVSSIVIPDKLSGKCIIPEPDKLKPKSIRAQLPSLTALEKKVIADNRHPEFVLGRDHYISAQNLAIGFTIKNGPETVLSSAALKYEDIKLFESFVLGVLKSFQSGKLKPCKDSRVSAGPLDIQEVIRQRDAAITEAIEKLKPKLAKAIGKTEEELTGKAPYVPFVLQINNNGRGVYVGTPDDFTKGDGCKMLHGKSYQALPLQTWTGGCKTSEVVGEAKRLTFATLAKDLGIPNEKAARDSFEKAAEAVWAQLMANPDCRERGEFMLKEMQDRPVQALSKIGNTGFNSYSVNLDYRTGCHMDGKNVAGSLSALIILETGQGFQGGLYMLPQFRLALAPQQGTVIFHCSDHADFGCHGNSEMFLPCENSHRISVVLYQTQLKDAHHVESSVARQLGIPHEVLTPAEKQPNKEARQFFARLQQNGHDHEHARDQAAAQAAAAATAAPAATTNGNVLQTDAARGDFGASPSAQPAQSNSIIMISSSDNTSKSRDRSGPAPRSIETSLTGQPSAPAQPIRGGGLQSFLTSGGAAPAVSGISMNAVSAARSSAAMHGGSASEQRSHAASTGAARSPRGGLVRAATGGGGGAQLLPQQLRQQLQQHNALSQGSSAAAAAVAVAAARQKSARGPATLAQLLEQAGLQHPQTTQSTQQRAASLDTLTALLTGGSQHNAHSISGAVQQLSAQNLLPPAANRNAMHEALARAAVSTGARSHSADAAAASRLASGSGMVTTGGAAGMARGAWRAAGPIGEGVKRGREGTPVDTLDPRLNWDAEMKRLLSQIAPQISLVPHNFQAAASNMHAQHASPTPPARQQRLAPPLFAVAAAAAQNSLNYDAQGAGANNLNGLAQQRRNRFTTHRNPSVPSTPAQQSIPEALEPVHSVVRRIQSNGHIPSASHASQSESSSQRKLAEFRRELQREIGSSPQRAPQHANHTSNLPAQGVQRTIGPSSEVSRTPPRRSSGGVGVHNTAQGGSPLAPYFSSHSGAGVHSAGPAPSGSPHTPLKPAASLQSVMHPPQSPTTPAQLASLNRSMHAPSNTQSSGVGGVARSDVARSDVALSHAGRCMSISTAGSISHSTQHTAGTPHRYDGSPSMHQAPSQSLHTHGGHASMSSASQNQTGHSPTLSSTLATQARQADHVQHASRPQQIQNGFSDLMFASAKASSRSKEPQNANPQSLGGRTTNAAYSMVQQNVQRAQHIQPKQQTSELSGNKTIRFNEQAAKVAEFSYAEAVNAMDKFQPPKDAPAVRSQANVAKAGNSMTTAPQQQVMHASHAYVQAPVKSPEQLIQEALDAKEQEVVLQKAANLQLANATTPSMRQYQMHNSNTTTGHMPASRIQDPASATKGLCVPQASVHGTACMQDMRCRGGGQAQSNATGNSVIDVGGVDQNQQARTNNNGNNQLQQANTQTGSDVNRSTAPNPAAAATVAAGPSMGATVVQVNAVAGPSTAPNLPQQVANRAWDSTRGGGDTTATAARGGVHGAPPANGTGVSVGARVQPNTAGLNTGTGAGPSGAAMPVWPWHDKVLLKIDHDKWAAWALNKRIS